MCVLDQSVCICSVIGVYSFHVQDQRSRVCFCFSRCVEAKIFNMYVMMCSYSDSCPHKHTQHMSLPG